MDYYASSKAIASSTQGFNLGCKYYAFNRDITARTLCNVACGLVSPSHLDGTLFRIGFYDGYASALLKYSGIKLPELTEEDIQTMSKFSEVEQKVVDSQPRVPFAKVADLLEIGAVFCMQHIRKTKGGQYGPQWVVTIQVSSNDADLINSSEKSEVDENNRCAFTLLVSKNDNAKRDMLLEGLKDCCPHHCITLTETKLTDGSKYHYLEEVAGEECPCQETEPEEEDYEDVPPPDETEEDYDPFLDDPSVTANKSLKRHAAQQRQQPGTVRQQPGTVRQQPGTVRQTGKSNPTPPAKAPSKGPVKKRG